MFRIRALLPASHYDRYLVTVTPRLQAKMLRNDFYHLTELILQKFKVAQSIDPTLQFPGGPLEQAYLIWRQTPRSMLNALLEANGFSLPNDFIQLSPITIFFDE